MQWLPALKLVLAGGWMPLAYAFSIQWLILMTLPREIQARLFDRQDWNAKQRIFTGLGKLFSLACLVFLVLTPLSPNLFLLIAGLLVAAIGLFGMLVGLMDYAVTPLDQPVTKRLYTISRHPQVMAVSIVILGTCIATASLPAFLALVISRLLQHFGILAEEESCLKRYGESYRTYLQQVPRYFLFF